MGRELVQKKKSAQYVTAKVGKGERGVKAEQAQIQLLSPSGGLKRGGGRAIQGGEASPGRDSDWLGGKR